MLRGIYSAASGMSSELMMMDNIADNLSNANTAGYKTNTLSFKTFGETLISQIQGTNAQPLGKLSQGSQVQNSSVQFQAGEMVSTGNPLDVAINGTGFFTVKQPTTNDILYTRAGNFTRDSQGLLVTQQGYRVQGDNGDIQIPQNVKTIEVSQYGQIMVNNQPIGRLKIAQFADTSTLTRMGSNTYSASVPPSANNANTTVAQGTLEQSNANVVTELVNSITASRAYETMQKSIQMQNESLQQDINTVGKVD